MSTQQEQIAHASEIQHLTKKQGKLLEQLPTAPDKKAILKEIQDIAVRLDELRGDVLL